MKLLHPIGLVLIATSVLIAGCTRQNKTTGEFAKHNSVYYWKTTFAPDSAERAFLAEHDIDRIYLHMFDVAVEPDYETGGSEVVPIATTRFEARVPDEIEIVPVAYITLDALRAMAGKERKFAPLIVDRLLAMSSYNECGKINEIQLDCDWTASTRESYAVLCQTVRDSLQKKEIELSITVRLHQLREPAPPADRGVLMLYNTGALKGHDTRNSILDIADVKPYMTRKRYPIPLDYAYPVFGWGVKFEGEKFVSIVTEADTVSQPGESVRRERPAAAEIVAVKKLVESYLGQPASGNLLYHLDYAQLKHYTHEEIDQILGR